MSGAAARMASMAASHAASVTRGRRVAFGGVHITKPLVQRLQLVHTRHNPRRGHERGGGEDGVNGRIARRIGYTRASGRLRWGTYNEAARPAPPTRPHSSQPAQGS